MSVMSSLHLDHAMSFEHWLLPPFRFRNSKEILRVLLASNLFLYLVDLLFLVIHFPWSAWQQLEVAISIEWDSLLR
jgi:hypothetical protein